MDSAAEKQPVRERLLKAARERFLADDYHRVTTRQIATQAGVNPSMIRYYFGHKAGLYESMIRETLTPLLEVLDGQSLESPAGFGDYLQLYYRSMARQPDFPKLILKVLALNQGPGRHFILELLERGRSRTVQRVEGLKRAGLIGAGTDPEILRMAFVSLAMTPMLLKSIFEEQRGRPMDEDFLEQLAAFNGMLLAHGLSPHTQEHSA